MKVKPILYPAILSVLAALLLSSCYSYKNVQIEVLKPAKIEIPSDIKSVSLLVANLEKKPTRGLNENDQIVYRIDSLIATNLVNKTHEKLNESPRFQRVVLHDKLYLKDEGKKLNPINLEDHEAMCYQNNTDGLLALEAISMKDTMLTYAVLKDYGFQYGHSFVLIFKSFWRFYMASEEKLLSQKVFSDTLFFDEFESARSFYNSLRTVENQDWLGEVVGMELSKNAFESFAPFWISVKRDIIVGGDEKMDLAYNYAKKNKWTQAAKIWQMFTKNENPKIASAACFNLAIASEVQGRLDLAKVWLQKSIDLYEFQVSSNYLKVLNYRDTESELLDKQFGVDLE